MPYSHAAMLLMLTAFIVAIFYSLDALYGERRDRSILFWKSLPVSDLTIVLAKASIPLLVLPLLVFVIVVAMQWTMLLLSTAALLTRGDSVATLWSQLPFFQLEFVLLYSLAVISLWYAPFYAWLLLVSAWARRTTFLWAVLPPLAIALVEWITFHTSVFRILAAAAFLWIRAPRLRLQDARWRLDRSAFYSPNPNHARPIPGQPGSVDRAGLRGRIPRRCGPAAPISGTHLIFFQ